MTDLVFFYGTLMRGFDRRLRAGIEPHLHDVGHGAISAALFDLGIYPAAVPTPDSWVRGEVYRADDLAFVLGELDQIEGYRPDDLDHSLYTRAEVDALLDDGRTVRVWAYFYNAPLGGAQRIESGDYFQYVKVR